ncbi:hypothetical protein KAM472_41690 [Aeromonas caviae]|nr:hypothetical protein KAM466_42660 [Aeromonas caviae]GKR25534.1 hypothetical protein KAM468_42740 [Aeromonas caviae]GKR34229.1 hypothetical protein KAM470_43020 [Aeromonas caviae]GKR42473.1 hypothetical protein KAM472_41690 [Aeromonas caviae]GKR50846.1 hypothetical protein KAM474_42640 [Aeromonas caviae]
MGGEDREGEPQGGGDGSNFLSFFGLSQSGAATGDGYLWHRAKNAGSALSCTEP